MGLRWLLEQPSESNLEDLPEFQFLLTIVQAALLKFAFGFSDISSGRSFPPTDFFIGCVFSLGST